MMRTFKTESSNNSLALRATSSGGGGTGCITATFRESYTRTYGVQSFETPLWHPRFSMNLVRFEARGSWYSMGYGSKFVLMDESSTVLAGFFINGDGNFERRVGDDVSVEAGVGLKIGLQNFPYDDYLCSVYSMCVTAWFDGNAGGGLVFRPIMLD